MSVRKRQAWGLPWFRKHDGFWYVTVKGRKYKLVKGDANKPENNRQAALDEWHRLMALAEVEDNKDGNFVWVVFERFLEHIERDHPRSFHNYRHYLQLFKDHFPALRVGGLRIGLMHEWFAAHPGWSESTKSYAASIVLSALNWAARPEQEFITRNPIRGMKLPGIRSRGAEAVIEDDEFGVLIEYANPWVRDALFFLRQTGTRPVNLARIEAKTIDAANRSVRLSAHKTAAKTKKPLVIPLTQAAYDLLVRLAKEHPAGPLFRTRRGNPLTWRLLARAFAHLKTTLKRQGKIKGNPILYGIRHTVATELLAKDVPDAKVAFILGHTGPTMLYRHYGHLDTTSKAIAEEMDRAINGDNASPASPEA